MLPGPLWPGMVAPDRALSKVPALLEPIVKIVKCRKQETRFVLPLCREAVGVFNIPSRDLFGQLYKLSN